MLGDEALPIKLKQRIALTPEVLPALTAMPSLVVAESVDVTGSRTLEIDQNGQTTEIQLVGIDTPVQGECFSQQAKTRLQELVNNGVSLEAIDSEYLVWLEGTSADPPTLVNLALVKEGLASAEDGDDQSRFGLVLREADRQAQAAELGLWGECTGVHGSYRIDPTPTPAPPMREDYPVLPDVRELAIRPGNLLGDKVAFTGPILTIGEPRLAESSGLAI